MTPPKGKWKLFDQLGPAETSEKIAGPIAESSLKIAKGFEMTQPKSPIEKLIADLESGEKQTLPELIESSKRAAEVIRAFSETAAIIKKYEGLTGETCRNVIAVTVEEANKIAGGGDEKL